MSDWSVVVVLNIRRRDASGQGDPAQDGHGQEGGRGTRDSKPSLEPLEKRGRLEVLEVMNEACVFFTVL